MAGDWIKMRTDLADDPAVISIAFKTGLDEDAVVGKLHRLWSWASRQCNAEGNGEGNAPGNAPGVTKMWIDRFTSAQGFGDALESCGWLVVTEDGIMFPKFDRHNTKTAKDRALTAKRVAEHKRKGNAEGNANGNGTSVTSIVSDALPREEKRRERNNKASIDASVVPIPPELDTPEVRQALADWLAHKADLRKPYKSPESVAKLFKKFAGMTTTDFVLAVDHSIGSNYQGLFSPTTVVVGKPSVEPQMCRVPTDEELQNWNPWA